MDRKPQLIVVLGPTASGKSDLAVELAKKFNGEIISADSRQVYRGMNIGTGKITEKKMRGIPHHLLDVASPKRRFTVAQYKKLADKTIKKILAKGKIPIICGGTGFYIQAITENLQIPEVKPDLKLRTRLEKIATKKLYEKLQKLDPRRAKNIDRYNRRRLIRALEIIYKTGKPVPPLNKIPPNLPLKREETPSFLKEGRGGFNTLYIGIKKSPDQLKKLIAVRLKKRLERGMIEEVKKLRRDGVSWKRLDDFGLEYRCISRHLQNKISREDMVTRLQKEIEHYAKRQMTWFKKYEPKTVWISNKKEAEKLASKFLKNSH